MGIGPRKTRQSWVDEVYVEAKATIKDTTLMTRVTAMLDPSRAPTLGQFKGTRAIPSLLQNAASPS